MFVAGRIDKNDYTSQGSLRIHPIPIKLPTAFFTELQNLQICMETQKTPNNKSNLEKENRAGGIRLLTSVDYHNIVTQLYLQYKIKLKNSFKKQMMLVPGTQQTVSSAMHKVNCILPLCYNCEKILHCFSFYI